MLGGKEKGGGEKNRAVLSIARSEKEKGRVRGAVQSSVLRGKKKKRKKKGEGKGGSPSPTIFLGRGGGGGGEAGLSGAVLAACNGLYIKLPRKEP